MDDSALIAELTAKVREAEEILRRRKDALAALRGKAGNSKGGKRASRGLRPDSIPAYAQAAIKSAKVSLSLDDLLAHMKRAHPEIELDSRKLSLALSRYVRTGKYFTWIDGKYGLK
jgi:hypothetical protein